MTPTRKLVTSIVVVSIGGISLLIALARLGLAPPGFGLVPPGYETSAARKPAPPERYLETRTGAALERTVKNAISYFGYECDRVRSIRRVEVEVLTQLEAEDGRWVDCGDDGAYGVIEIPAGFKVVKR